MSPKDYNKISVPVKVNTAFNSKRNIKINSIYEEPKLTLFKYNKGKKIKKSDFYICINNCTELLDENAYSYDNISGVVKFNFEIFYLNDINVRFKKVSYLKKFISNVLDIDVVKAATRLKGSITMAKKSDDAYYAIDDINGGSGQFNSAEYYYVGMGGYTDNHIIHNGQYMGAYKVVPKAVRKKAISVTKTKASGSDQDFYVKLPSSFTITKKDGEGNVTGKATINIDEDSRWLLMWCSGAHQASDTPNQLHISVTATVTNSVVTFKLQSTNSATTQTASGSFSLKNELYSITIQKQLKNKTTGANDNWPKNGIRFRIYSTECKNSDASCGDMEQSKRTDENGQVTFSGLESGTYYIKEIFQEDSTTSSISSTNFFRDASCNGVGIGYNSDGTLKDPNNADKVLKVTVPSSGVIGYYDSNDSDTGYDYTYCNVNKRYTVEVTKVDFSTREKKKGFTFAFSNGYIGDDRLEETGDDGVARFCDITLPVKFNISESAMAAEYWGPDDSLTEVDPSNLAEYPDYKDCRTDSDIIAIRKNVGTFENEHYHYCFAVKKVDAITKEPLAGATFSVPGLTMYNSAGETAATLDDGLAYFFTGRNGSGTYTVTEETAPSGYAKADPVENLSPVLMSQETTDATYNSISYCSAGSAAVEVPNSKYVINWFKENDSNDSNSTKRADGALFKVKDPSGKYITVDGTESVTDAGNPATTKTCYKYKGSVDSAASASVLTAGANGDKGGVCISGLEDGTYTVIETQPTQNHTFGSSLTLQMDATTVFYTDKIFTNYPTYVEIEKKVTDSERVSNSLDDSVLKKIETNKLMKIPFEVYKADANGAATGDPISFVEIDGVYHDASSVDVNSETQTTTLYLNNERKIKLSHLSWETGTQQYVLKEKGHKTSDACTCTTDPDCIGYYYPKSDQEVKFTITKCSSSSSVDNTTANTTVGTGTCPNTYVAKVGDQDNTPTELWFTKKDFYSYENSEDIADSVNFENDKERSDFDRIHFKVKDSNGNYLKFVDIGSHITDSDKKCLKDDDYHEYRYITDAELNLLSEEERSQLTIVEELQTCGGHIRITNLCRGKSFTVEEVSVPEDSVFVLEKDSNGKNPQVTYTVPCCDNDTVTNKTTTTIIKDKGTRVRFEKRDSKYNYLIPDETTTFQVYQCEKGVECHPTDNVSNMAGATGVRKIMKFKDKEYLTAEDLATPLDQEDGKDNGSVIQHTDQLVNGDTDYESKYKVYKAVSDSDLSNNETYVTDLNPDKGILILRYLPAGYNYVLVETVSPKGYMLPDGRRRETSFTITKETVKVEEVNVPNKPVSLLVRKYDNKGNLLEGAEFTISKAKNCNMNVAPNKVEREDALTLKTIRDGVYEVRPTGDTTKFKTCQDRPGALCNDINGTLTHQLYTTETYGNSMGDFSQLLNDRSEPVVIEAGEALIQYLNYGACYIIEEKKAPDGFSLPENEEDRFVMVKMTDKEQVVDTYDQLVNKPTPFTFYKYDEYNNLLDGGKYKLQKLNQDKIYKDVPVTEEEEDGTIYYKVDPNSQNYLMETKNGTATVYYLDEGQYRILEVEAPPGYELPIKTINVATFFVDKDGKTYGSNIIANKPKTEVKEIKPSASAKLVVDIKTGQKVIRYGLIITVMILAISGLMYFSRKNKEENDNNEKK